MDTPTPRDILIAALKGAFNDHPIITLQIAGTDADGKETSIDVPAVQIGDMWALHPARSLAFGGWNCTHIPTGFGIRRFNSLPQALLSLGVLLASGLEWEGITTAAEFSQLIIDNAATAKAIRKALALISEMDESAIV